VNFGQLSNYFVVFARTKYTCATKSKIKFEKSTFLIIYDWGQKSFSNCANLSIVNIVVFILWQFYPFVVKSVMTYTMIDLSHVRLISIEYILTIKW